MASKPAGQSNTTRGRREGARRLIAGLRVSPQDEALLDVVRPFLPDAGSEGELAYRLWRRGLELTLAEVVGFGATLPPGITEEFIAALAARRLLLSMPLLRRTGMLGLLGVELVSTDEAPAVPDALEAAQHEDCIDQGVSDVVAGLGANDFL